MLSRQRPAREVQRLGQSSGAACLVELGLQDVDELLAVHPMARRHGQQLDQRSGSAAPPCVLGYRASAELSPEPAEYADA
jgi:hypothetical protein